MHDAEIQANGPTAEAAGPGASPPPFRDARAAEGIRTLAALEADAILTAVRLCGGNMSEAARRLGIGRSTLYRKLAALRGEGG